MSAVYCGTYAKYNAGNLFGAWLQLDNFADKAEFLAACVELHKDEADPELMFQDWENIPAGLVGESHIDETVWEWLALDDNERRTVELYWESVDADADISDALEAYLGEYETAGDYAEEYWEQTGDLSKVPEAVRYHIDWESVARDMQHNGEVQLIEVAYREIHAFRI